MSIHGRLVAVVVFFLLASLAVAMAPAHVRRQRLSVLSLTAEGYRHAWLMQAAWLGYSLISVANVAYEGLTHRLTPWVSGLLLISALALGALACVRTPSFDRQTASGRDTPRRLDRAEAVFATGVLAAVAAIVFEAGYVRPRLLAPALIWASFTGLALHKATARTTHKKAQGLYETLALMLTLVGAALIEIPFAS